MGDLRKSIVAFALAMTAFSTASAWAQPAAPAPADPPSPAPPSDQAPPPAIARIVEAPRSGETVPGAAPVASPEPKPIAGWDRGFFIRSEDGNFLMRIGLRAAALFTYKIPAVAADAKLGSANEAQFSIPRARITLDGNVFTPKLTYRIETEFGKGQARLNDVVWQYNFVPGWLGLRVGQWKVPFSRQFMSSDFELAFVDRTLTQSAFGLEREIGLALTNDYEKSPSFEYAVGFFNGTGTLTKTTADVTVDPVTGKGSIANAKQTNVARRVHPTIIARAGYNSDGVKGYSEHDFEGGDPRVGIGASTIVDFQADPQAPGMVRGEADLIFKAYGFTATIAGYVRSVQATDPDATTYATTGFVDQRFDAVSFFAQGGYLIAGVVEPAFRYARLSGPGSFDTLSEFSGALSAFFFKTNFQVAADVTGIRDESKRYTDWLVRTQVHGYF